MTGRASQLVSQLLHWPFPIHHIQLAQRASLVLVIKRLPQGLTAAPIFTFVPTLYKNAKAMAHEKANPFALLIVPNGSVYSLLLDIDLCRRTRKRMMK